MSPPPVHVFISSTWLDMKPEREAVEAVLQRMRETKFAGMEYFGSRDEDARGTSLIEVDRSHVYVGIFGGRYGSGITEAEYRRARELKLPCFIYIKDEACVSPDKQEADAHKSRRLADLKGELRKNHIISTFSNPDDLAAKVTADLHRWLFDAYLAPRLEKAARGQSPREDAQVLLAAIKDPSALDPGLLDRLQKSGFVLAQGSGGVAIGGPVSGTTITTVGTQLNYYQPQDPSRATGPGGGVIQFGSGNKIGTISFGDVAGRDIVKTTTTATAPIQGNQELLALIDQLRADVAKLEGAPKGKRQDADDELRKAKEAAQEGARPSLLEKLEGAQKILLSLGGSITAAPQLADAVGTLLQRAMGLRS